MTDPNLVYNLRAKLDAAGHYDEFEVDRVVAVELNPDAKQSELVAAVEPVVDRLHRTYKAAQSAKRLTTLSVTSILPPAMHSWLFICPNTRTTDCRAPSTC